MSSGSDDVDAFFGNGSDLPKHFCLLGWEFVLLNLQVLVTFKSVGVSRETKTVRHHLVRGYLFIGTLLLLGLLLFQT